MNQVQDIRLYMFLRLVMLYSVLVSTVLYQRSGILDNDVILKTYFVTFFTFSVTSVFVFLYEKAKRVSYFLASQVAYDILFTTVLIFYTGPYDSMYTVFFLFNIIFAAILFQGRGALLAALFSAILYTFVTWLNSERISSEKFFSMLTTLTAFVAIALLAGQLIEELRKSRTKIQSLELLSEEIVESLDSGLLGLDSQDVIRKINKTGQQLLRIQSVETVVGHSLREVLPSFSGVEANQIREIAIDGQMRRMLITRVGLPDKRSMLLIRDLTDVLNLEEKVRMQERLAGIGRLATGVAHEIRNPIASISGSAQLLADAGEDKNETKRLLNIILRESERVDRLVAQLLKFTRPSLIERNNVQLDRIIQDCVEALKTRPDFHASKIEISLNVANNLKVKGSSDQLSEVVTNLLVNAMQALAEQGANSAKKLKVDALKREDHIELIVSDNGPGIPQQFRSRIFDPFFTTKSYGTGLGLAQVYKIIREHEGQVDVETEEGKGTRLRIRLPV